MILAGSGGKVMFTGIVERTVQIIGVQDSGAPPKITKCFRPKASSGVNGVSLTIASIEESRFEVALIPTTLVSTTLGKRDVGWLFNLEADILSKQVVAFLERRLTSAS